MPPPPKATAPATEYGRQRDHRDNPFHQIARGARESPCPRPSNDARNSPTPAPAPDDARSAIAPHLPAAPVPAAICESTPAARPPTRYHATTPRFPKSASVPAPRPGHLPSPGKLHKPAAPDFRASDKTFASSANKVPPTGLNFV